MSAEGPTAYVPSKSSSHRLWRAVITINMAPERTELETDDSGALIVPPEGIGSPSPHSRFLIQHAGDGWLLKARESDTLPSPAERLRALEEWLKTLPPGPGLGPEAIRRDAIYD